MMLILNGTLLSFLKDSVLLFGYDMEELFINYFSCSPTELCASVVFVRQKSKRLANGNTTQVPNLGIGEQVFR